MNKQIDRFQTQIQLDSISNRSDKSQASMPWMCYLCGPDRSQNDSDFSSGHKDKVRLSKIAKNKRIDQKRGSVNYSKEFIQNFNIPQSNNKTKFNDLAQKKMVKTQMTTEPKTFSINSSTRTFQTIRTPIDTTIQNQYKNMQPIKKNEFRNISFQNITNQDSFRRIDDFPLNMQKNRQTYFPTQKAQNNFSKNAGNYQLNLFENIYNTRPNNNTQIDDLNRGIRIKTQYSTPRVYFVNQNVKKQLISSTSKQILQTRIEDEISRNKNPSSFSTEEQITFPMPLKNSIEEKCIRNQSIKQAKHSTLNEVKQNIPMFKKKSSHSGKTPKFLSNIKKVSSRNEPGQLHVSSSLSDRSTSDYTHFGNKVKIGIRKVESIQSQQSDHYSEVISQGGRSFLMPQIWQVEQMSRISSRSGFKNWEEDEQEGQPRNFLKI